MFHRGGRGGVRSFLGLGLVWAGGLAGLAFLAVKRALDSRCGEDDGGGARMTRGVGGILAGL